MAIVLIQRLIRDDRTLNKSHRLGHAAGVISAMAACTWYLYDNSESLRWLVTASLIPCGGTFCWLGLLGLSWLHL